MYPHESSKLVPKKWDGGERFDSFIARHILLKLSINMDFIKKNIEEDSNGCWNWLKSCSSQGYGQFTKNKKYWTTHRYVFTKQYGEIPEGLVIRHVCHNRKCCNPEHLRVGTQKDNYEDSLDAHKQADTQRAKFCIIDNIYYPSVRKAHLDLGLSFSSLAKYTNPTTRVFDILAYRKACFIANTKPKI